MKTTIILVFSMLLSTSCWAITLDEAKRQGLVGEQQNGYIINVTHPVSYEVSLVIEEVNIKRREAYQQVATKNGITLGQVTSLAGQKAIEKTAKGQFVEGVDGQWQRK